MDDRTASLHNLKSAARDAAERLDFAEVETLLSRVDQVETEIMAETKELRAANALLRGDVNQAYAIYSAAADAFRELDVVEYADRRNQYRSKLYNHGLRYGGPGLPRAADMIRPAIAALKDRAHQREWAAYTQNLANALAVQGTRTPGAAGADLLAQAVTAYRDALTVRTRDADPLNWAMTMQNLATALADQGTRTPGAAGADLLAQAVTAYRDALTVRTRDAHPLDWARTMQNLAIALRAKGTRTPGAAGADLLARAVTTYRDALTVTIRNAHPLDWAMTMQNLAGSLAAQGTRTPGAAGADLLAQAVTAYRDALTVRTRDAHQADWAMTQENMGLLYEDWADHDTCTDPIPHLRAALDHFDAALTVFDPVYMAFYYNKATEDRARVRARLDALTA